MHVILVVSLAFFTVRRFKIYSRLPRLFDHPIRTKDILYFQTNTVLWMDHGDDQRFPDVHALHRHYHLVLLNYRRIPRHRFRTDNGFSVSGRSCFDVAVGISDTFSATTVRQQFYFLDP